MDYRFAGDFSKAPTGPFTATNKKLVWTDPSGTITYDADPDGRYYSIVADDRFPQGRACRQLYPKGEVGTGSKAYYVRYKSPQTIANLEYIMCFEPDFSFMTPNTSKVCVGKIGPQINWGEVGGDAAKRGTRDMWVWNGGGSNYPNPKLCPAGQDQRSGSPLIQPPVYGPPIATNQLYKLRCQIQGGPTGFMRYWIDDQQVAEAHGNYMATPQDDVIYDFAFWHGGATPDYAPEHDSYARCGGVRMWSGEAYWEGNGDSGGGTGGGVTITLGSTTYDVAGSLTLTERK